MTSVPDPGYTLPHVPTVVDLVDAFTASDDLTRGLDLVATIALDPVAAAGALAGVCGLIAGLFDLDDPGAQSLLVLLSLKEVVDAVDPNEGDPRA